MKYALKIGMTIYWRVFLEIMQKIIKI